jgi:uncharacterized protein (TIGR03437 family)
MRLVSALNPGSALVPLFIVVAAYAQTPQFLRKDIATANPASRALFASREVMFGDFNGDGRPDLAITGSVGQDGISIIHNAGNGQFDRPVHNTYRASGVLTAADVNADGRTDIIDGAWWDPSGRVLLNRGNGRLEPQPQIPGLRFPLAVGDLNGDGSADVVHMNSCSEEPSGCTHGLRVLLGNGNGTFRTAATYPMVTVAEIAVADFTVDGKVDVGARFGESILIFRGRGDGTLEPPEGTRGDSLLIADFDNDRVPDVVTRSEVLLGNGDGTFRFGITYQELPDGFSPPFAAADIDADGNMDFVVGSYYLYPAGNRVFVYRGRGDGTMLPATVHTVGWGAFNGGAADFDGDGRVDLVTSNRTSHTISLLLSGGAQDRRLVRALSAASGTALVAPDSLATLYPSLPGSTDDAHLEVRDSGGATHLAPVLYMSGTQINFLVPAGVALGEATLHLVNGRETVQVGTLEVERFAPALFMANPFALTPTAWYTVAGGESKPILGCPDPGQCEPTPIDPTPNDSYLTFLATGFGNATPANVRVVIRGQDLEVIGVTPRSTPGVTEIRVRVPTENYDFWELPGGEFVLSVDGVRANSAWLVFSKP